MTRYGGLKQEHSRSLVRRSIAFLLACSTWSSCAKMVSAFSSERDGAAVKSLKTSNDSRVQSCLVETNGVAGEKRWLSSRAGVAGTNVERLKPRSRSQFSRDIDEHWGMKNEDSSELWSSTPLAMAGCIGMSVIIKSKGWTLDGGPRQSDGLGRKKLVQRASFVGVSIAVGVGIALGVRFAYARRFRGGFPDLRVTP